MDDKWTFSHKVTGITADQYWKVAFTDELEQWQYKQLKMGELRVLSISENKDKSIHRIVKVTPAERLQKYVLSFISEEYKPTYYITYQDKYNKMMTFSSIFEESIKNYVPILKGTIIVKDEGKNEFGKPVITQYIQIELKIDLGWRDSGFLCNIVGKTVNYTLLTFLKQTTNREMFNMLQTVPRYFEELNKK